jgi:retinol dehydrogenase-12
LDNLNSERKYNPIDAYMQSKICNVLFTRELAKRLAGTKVTVNALHPGVIKTELGRYLVDTYGLIAVPLQVLLYPIILWVFKSVPQGAQTSIHCAVSEELNNVSGCYFSDCKQKDILPHGFNQRDAARLWEQSEKMCNL